MGERERRGETEKEGGVGTGARLRNGEEVLLTIGKDGGRGSGMSVWKQGGPGHSWVSSTGILAGPASSPSYAPVDRAGSFLLARHLVLDVDSFSKP